MDRNSQMYRFFAPSKSYIAILAVVFVLFIGSVAGAVIKDHQPIPDPVQMTIDAPSGQYSYIDVQLMTTWVLKVTGDSSYTYYEAVDTDGNWFVVRLTDREYEGFRDIVEYSYSDDANAPVPAPIRLPGVTHTFPSDDAKNLAEMYNVPTSEYYEGFGHTYLDGYQRPGGGSAFYAAAIVFGTVLLTLAISFGIRQSHSKKSLRALEGTNAEAEFVSATALRFDSQGLVLTDHYLFSKETGLAMPYEDLVWVFSSDLRYMFIPIGKSLKACLLDGRCVALSAKNLNDMVINELYSVLAAKYPLLLTGFSSENQRLCRSRQQEYRQNKR